jgi:hypothetical protein
MSAFTTFLMSLKVQVAAGTSEGTGWELAQSQDDTAHPFLVKTITVNEEARKDRL